MAAPDFNIILKKEAKTSLQAFKDRSLLRRRFGDKAVELYGAIDSGKPAGELMRGLGISEEDFVEMLEFMNNNAMVSVASQDGGAPGLSQAGEDAPEGESEPPEDEAPDPGGAGSPSEEDGPDDSAEEEQPGPAPPAKPRAKAAPGGMMEGEKMLSPLEKILFDSYGQLGVRVYNLIDGEKTAEEILRETGMSEAKLVEILEFMDERGIIKLEKPPSGGPDPGNGADDPGGIDKDDSGDAEKEDESKPAREPRFTPMAEDVPEGKPFDPPPAPEKAPPEAKESGHGIPEEPGEDIVLVDVPRMEKMSLMQRAGMFADISTKFDKRADSLMKLVDGNRDFVELALTTGMALYEIDSVLAHFGRKGLVTFTQLDRLEIKKRYGEDGFSIYKKYGRDGLLLYEMIGKEASLKDIILKSRVDPERAIDIFMFIHRVLGLDVPLDRDIIYRQIGLKK